MVFIQETKDGTYIKNSDKHESVRTHWMAFYVNGDNVRASYDALYLHRIGVEHIPNEIIIFIGIKNIITNIYRVQAKQSTRFTDFML